MAGSRTQAGRDAIRRSAFVDLLRTVAVVSIIFLHVALSNLSRIPWAPDNELYYKIATVLGPIYSNETLVFISLFLALSRFEKADFRSFYRARLARIGLPFAGFTILYVALDAVWQQQGVIFKFSPAEAAALLVVAGLGEYHLHFLPALLLLVGLLPLYARPIPLPLTLTLLLAGCFARFVVQYLVIGDTPVANLTTVQLLLLHTGKLLAYLPFGFLAQWFVGRTAGRPPSILPAILVLAGIAVLDLAIMTPSVIAAGGRLELGVVLHELLGTALVVVGIFLGFACAPALRSLGDMDALSAEFQSRAFLVLMIHPLFLKLFNLLVPPHPGNFLFDALCVAFVLFASLVTASVLKRIGAEVRHDHPARHSSAVDR